MIKLVSIEMWSEILVVVTFLCWFYDFTPNLKPHGIMATVSVVSCLGADLAWSRLGIVVEGWVMLEYRGIFLFLLVQ